MDKEKKQLIQDADWTRITLELNRYARILAYRKRWRSGNRNMLAEGKSPEDIVQESSRKFFDETRNWNPQ